MLSPRLVEARAVFSVPAAFWKSVAAAGDLVRYVALSRGCTSLALPTPSRPRYPPRVLEAQRKARKIRETATLLPFWHIGMGREYQRFLPRGWNYVSD